MCNQQSFKLIGKAWSSLICFLVGLGFYAPAVGVKFLGLLITLPFIFLLDIRFFVNSIQLFLKDRTRLNQLMYGLLALICVVIVSFFGLHTDKVLIKVGGLFLLYVYLLYAIDDQALIRGMKYGMSATVFVAGLQFFYFWVNKSFFELRKPDFIDIATSTGNILSASSEVGLPIRASGLAGEPGFLSSLLLFSTLLFRTPWMLVVILLGLLFSLSKITFFAAPLLVTIHTATNKRWSPGLAVLGYIAIFIALCAGSIFIYHLNSQKAAQLSISWIDRTYPFFTYLYEYDLPRKVFGVGMYATAERLFPHLCEAMRNSHYQDVDADCLLYPHSWLGSLALETGLLGLGGVGVLFARFGRSRDSLRGLFFFLVAFMNVFYLTTYPIFAFALAYIIKDNRETKGILQKDF